jgi:hypothetical protein
MLWLFENLLKIEIVDWQEYAAKRHLKPGKTMQDSLANNINKILFAPEI